MVHLHQYRQLAIAAVLVIVALAYANALRVPFVFEDSVTVTQNAAVHTGEALLRFSGDRPLTTATYAVNWWLGGSSIAGYHAFNISVHLVNILLVWLLCQRLGCSGPVSGLTALIFGLHPLQTEAVTYITGRSEVLAATFVLCGLIAFMDRSPWRWVGVGLYLYLAMLAKPTGVYLAVYVAGFLVIQYGWRWLIPALPVVAYLGLRINGSAAFTMQWFAVQASATLRYVQLFIYPRQAVDWGWIIPFSQSAFLFAVFAVGLAVLVSASVSFKGNLATAGVLLFLGIIARNVLVAPDVLVEHRMYLPIVGLSLLTALGIENLESLRRPAIIALTALLFVLTVERNDVWASERSLWSDAAATAPWSARAHANLGREHRLDGNALAAIQEYRAAVDLAKAQPLTGVGRLVHADLISGAQSNLGELLMRGGEFEAAERELRAVLDARPHFMPAAVNLSNVMLREGRPAEAVTVIDSLLASRNGDDRDADIAGLFYNKGLAVWLMGECGQARSNFEAAKSRGISRLPHLTGCEATSD